MPSAQPAIPELPWPPGRLVVEAPAPAAPRPRWIVTQEQFAGGDEPTDTPPAEAAPATPIEPRLGAVSGSAPREPGPAEPERPVLRPSSKALPRYGVPGLPPRPETEPSSGGDQPSAAAETRPNAAAEAQPAPPAEPADPAEPDWPEGI